MRRLRAAAVFVAALAVTRVAAQDGPAFEVASIRSNTSGDPVSGTHNLPGGRVTITNLPLRNMIRTAYGANDLEVIGGPDWVDGDRWDVLAAAAPGSPVDAPWQALLTERFKLRAHLEPRERPIYRLVFARSDRRLGPEIRATACRSDDLDCGRTSANTNGIGSGAITGVARTAAEIGTSLSRYAERRVFDATGLDAARYDFELRWSEEVSIFTALQEQLGPETRTRQRPCRRPFHRRRRETGARLAKTRAAGGRPPIACPDLQVSTTL